MNFVSKFLVSAKKPQGSYLAFKLAPASKQEILGTFTPRYSRVICDHVTLEYNNPTEELKQEFTRASLEIIGYQFGPGVDCLAVKVNGSLFRPDGERFHLTLSVKGSHKPVESIDLLRRQGYNETIPFSIQGDLEFLPK